MLWLIWRSEVNSQESVPFFCHVGPGDGTQLIAFSSKCLYSLNLLASLSSISFCYTWSSGYSQASLVSPLTAANFWQGPDFQRSVPSLLVKIALTSDRCSQQSSAEYFCPSWKTNKLSVQCATPCGKVLQQNERKEGFGVESAQNVVLLCARQCEGSLEGKAVT